jgi:threonine dehydratase
MENGLFRQKSMDHISSPESLHDYMRVTSPRLWMILAAIVALLEGSKLVAEGAGATGIAAWLFDRIDASLRTAVVVSGGNVDISALEKIIDRVIQRRT